MRRQLIAFVLVAGLAGLAGGGLAACRDDDGSAGRAARPGVTREACPRAIDRSKGCIYLGFISSDAVSIDVQQRFWDRVNRAGGIGGYEIDAVTYVRDNRGDPAVHARAYREIRDRVLALGQSMGETTTASVITQMRADDMVAVPASSSSAWQFEPTVLASGASYCAEAVDAVDYARTVGPVRSVLAVHLPGNYGDDHAAGVKAATAANGATFINIKTDPGADKQAGAVAAILARRPDLVLLAVNPAETAVIVRGAADGGFTGRIIGASPSWSPDLLSGPAAPALRALYEQSAPWGPWSADTPGHRAMRAALGSVPPHEGQVAGWVRSYPLKAALVAAANNGEVTRDGLARAARGLGAVDYEGMLPAGTADRSVILSPATGTGVADVPVVRDFFAGPTLAGITRDHPCYQDL